MDTDNSRKVITFTKLDAARRQLEMAIRLWFQDADPVSVHTLAAAARQIVIGINRKRGGEPMGADRPEIRVEMRDEAYDALARAENFFKHGSRDPNATLDFASEATRFYILEAAGRFIEIVGERPPILRAFILYQVLEYPGVFKPAYIEELHRSGAIKGLARFSRGEFLSYALQAFDKGNTA